MQSTVRLQSFLYLLKKKKKKNFAPLRHKPFAYFGGEKKSKSNRELFKLFLERDKIN